MSVDLEVLAGITGVLKQHMRILSCKHDEQSDELVKELIWKEMVNINDLYSCWVEDEQASIIPMRAYSCDE